MRRLGYIAIVIAFIGILSIAFEPMIHKAGLGGALSEKSGQVVDKGSGHGIPGVHIVALWETDASGPGHANGGCDLQRIVTTDQEGRYVIPDVANDLEFDRIWLRRIIARVLRIFVPDESHHWRIVPIKVDYVRSGDEDLLASAASARNPPDRDFRWYWSQPPMAGSTIAPIVMSDREIAPIEHMVYLSVLKRLSQCNYYGNEPKRSGNEPEYEAINQEMSERAKALICKIPPDMEVPPHVLSAFAYLLNDEQLMLRLKKIMGQTMWTMRPHPSGAVCSAVRESVL